MKNREKELTKVTLVGSIGNLVLLTFKFVAGIVGHSSAMIADAVHSLSDFVTDIIVLVFVRIGSRPQDASHDYGHGKFETLATFFVALALVAAKEALYRYTVVKGKTLDSQVVVANAWHHRSDALSSIGAAIGIGGALILGQRWAVLDPLASIVVGAMLVKVAWDLLKGSTGS